MKAVLSLILERIVISLDMRDTHISLKLHLLKERLFDGFKKEKSEHQAKSEDDLGEKPEAF